MCVLPTSIYMHHVSACCLQSLSEDIGPFGTRVVNYHVGARNQIRVLCKNSLCS